MADALLLPPCVVRAVLLLLVTGCVQQSTVAPGESHSIQFDWPGGHAPQLDFLLVVDDTAAMTPYHQKVLDLGPMAAWSLYHDGFGVPDMHVGVTRTSGGPVTFLSDVHNNDGSRATSYTGELATAITALLDVGSSSAVPPQPLAAIERALSDTDFVRADTNFMAVTISSDDDHSLEGVDHYVSTVMSLPRDTMATGIFPAQAPRLEAFHAAFDPFGKGIHVPIDNMDWSRVFSPLTDVIVDGWYPCFEQALPEPYECTVSMIDDAGSETVLAPCDITPTGACWQMVVDNQCFTDHGFGTTIEVRGYARQYRPHVVGECVSQ